MGDIIEIENTGLLSDCDILKAMENSELVICPFNDKNLTPLGYNLSFTKFILSTNNNLLYNIQTDKETNEIYCIIEPNDTVLILTKEAVWVSEKYAGTFHSKVGIVSKGFGHISTTLDPNWEGPLLFSLNNPTNQRIKLVIGEDDKDGIKYKTFVTLMFYRMVSKSTGIQDNRPCRIEILKETMDNLKNSKKYLKDSKKYSRLIHTIDKIRDFEEYQVGIGKVEEQFRKDKITEFNYKYNRFASVLNGYIDEATEISKSIINGNYIKYYIGIALLVLIGFLTVAVIGLSAYRTKDSNLIAIIAIFTSIYLFLCQSIENVLRDKLL